MTEKEFLQQVENSEALGYLINRAGHTMAYGLRTSIEEQGIELPFEQLKVLFMLWQKDGMYQSEVVNGVYKDKTTITRGLHNLEKHNLIVRVKDEKDKRNKKVFLTHKGKELRNLVIPLAFEMEKKAIEKISKKELEIFRKVLKKIYHNIDQ